MNRNIFFATHECFQEKSEGQKLETISALNNEEQLSGKKNSSWIYFHDVH